MTKSVLIPQEKITVLGTVVDSVKMRMSLPVEKENNIVELLQSNLAVYHLKIRDLAKIIISVSFRKTVL